MRCLTPLLCLCLALLPACGQEDDGPVSIGGGGTSGGTVADTGAGGGSDVVADAGGGATDAGGSSGGGSTDAGSGGGGGDVALDVGTFGGVTKPTEAIEITGLWRIGQNANVHLNSVRMGKVEVVHYDNDKNLAYTTAPLGVSGPGGVARQGVYSVYQWVEPKDGVTYLCQVDTNLNTEVAALQSTKTADASKLDTGCNLGPWMRLETLELAGVWQSGFGGNETIDPLVMGIVDVIEWDNQTNTLYTRNPEGTGGFSGKYNRIVWTEFADGPAWYCKLDLGLDSLEDAKKSTKKADDNDPDTSGCNGFAWAKLMPLAVRGSYKRGDGVLAHLTRFWWEGRLIAGFDNAKREAWLRNPPEAAELPNRYSKLLWTKPKDGGFWACLVEDGLSDLDSAQQSAATADASDPGKGGCQGKPWTRYDKLK